MATYRPAFDWSVLDPNAVTPSNVTNLGLWQRMFNPVQRPQVMMSEALGMGAGNTFNAGNVLKALRQSGPYAFKATGAPTLANMAGQFALAQSGLPRNVQLPASLALSSGANFASLARLGVPLKAAGGMAGAGLVGAGLQYGVDPRDNPGFDVHDVGQGLGTAAFVAPLALALAPTGPVGWGITAAAAGLAGLGSATNWFGLGPKKNYYTEEEVAKDLREAGVEAGRAKEYADDVLQAIVEGQDVSPEKVPNAVRKQFQKAIAQIAPQSTIIDPTTQLLGEIFGVDVGGGQTDLEKMFADTSGIVNQYTQDYRKQLYPYLMQLGQLGTQIENMPTDAIAPEYRALADANQHLAAMQLNVMAQQLQQESFQTPMNVWKDFAYGLRSGSFGGGGSSSDQSIADLLQQYAPQQQG